MIDCFSPKLFYYGYPHLSLPKQNVYTSKLIYCFNVLIYIFTILPRLLLKVFKALQLHAGLMIMIKSLLLEFFVVLSLYFWIIFELVRILALLIRPIHLVFRYVFHFNYINIKLVITILLFFLKYVLSIQIKTLRLRHMNKFLYYFFITILYIFRRMAETTDLILCTGFYILILIRLVFCLLWIILTFI